MTTATPARRVVCRVLDDDLFRADEKGELRHCTLVTVLSETKAGPVSGLYEALDCGGYFRVRKLGARPEVYTVSVRDGAAQSCTCPAATYRPEDGPCKHNLAVQSLLHPAEESHAQL